MSSMVDSRGASGFAAAGGQRHREPGSRALYQWISTDPCRGCALHGDHDSVVNVHSGSLRSPADSGSGRRCSSSASPTRSHSSITSVSPKRASAAGARGGSPARVRRVGARSASNNAHSKARRQPASRPTSCASISAGASAPARTLQGNRVKERVGHRPVKSAASERLAHNCGSPNTWRVRARPRTHARRRATLPRGPSTTFAFAGRSARSAEYAAGKSAPSRCSAVVLAL